VGDDGLVRAGRFDTPDAFSGTWDSTRPLDCITPAAGPLRGDTLPPQKPPPQSGPVIGQAPDAPIVPPAATPVATVTSDVDVYDVPGGNGNKIGILRSGRKVNLVGSCKPQDWCQVAGADVPSGKGWVWGNLQF